MLGAVYQQLKSPKKITNDPTSLADPMWWGQLVWGGSSYRFCGLKGQMPMAFPTFRCFYHRSCGCFAQPMRSAYPHKSRGFQTVSGVPGGCGTIAGPAARRTRYQYTFGVFAASVRDLPQSCNCFEQLMAGASPNRKLVSKASLGSAGGGSVGHAIVWCWTCSPKTRLLLVHFR